MSQSTLSPSTFSPEEKAIIEQQLERMVNDTHFSNSRRFPSFLRYIVTETLAGNTDHLKERTLGVEVFGKNINYDTATEPIVRVTAAEIRKRIAQYYQDPGHTDEPRLSLPPGSYVPHFEFPSTAGALPRTESPALLPPTDTVPNTAVGSPTPSRAARYGAAVVLLALVLAATLFGWHHVRRSAFTEFWAPILGTPDPILFSVADQTGYGSLSLRDAANPLHQVELKDALTAVVIDDLTVITKIAGVLESQGHRYTLRGESATTLSDLRGGPSIIVGAFDNAWTLRLLNPLRFHFANNPAMTSFSIVDSKPGGHTPWTVDRKEQLATNNYEDYAIVARFTDATTGQPTLIAAGIGRGGTMAAGEFLTTPDLLRQALSQKPSTHSDNIEIVLSTRIIGGEPGTPRVAAVYYW